MPAFSWYPVRDLNPCYHLERVTEAVRPVPANINKCCLTCANVVGQSGAVQPVPSDANEFIGKLIGKVAPHLTIPGLAS